MPPGNVIDGRAIANQLQAELARRVAALQSRGARPGLAFIRVGEDPASKVYVGRKEKTCGDLGIYSETHVLPQNTPEAELVALLGA
jgi:methylenetetrahydrofolate dehydrogenase (NADP+)/methenyltetrahydrofolate cyclohydrolase